MPLFLFITGCSMPVAFSRYREQGCLRTLWRVLRRVALLFGLGMVVQGNLCSGNHKHMSLFCNTLQAIAAGYLISAVVLLFWNWRGQLLSCLTLLGAYWALLRFVPYNGQPGGLFQPQNNLAYYIDCTVQGHWQDGTPYTWILTSLAFGAMTLLGGLGGGVVFRQSGWRVVHIFCVSGVLCLGGALLLELDTPLIKHLFTSTMVLWSGGWCLLLLALFHVVFDMLPGMRYVAFPLQVVGCNGCWPICSPIRPAWGTQPVGEYRISAFPVGRIPTFILVPFLWFIMARVVFSLPASSVSPGLVDSFFSFHAEILC